MGGQARGGLGSDAKIPVEGDGPAPKDPAMDTLGIALSGMRSASTRLAVSAHNVANLLTEGFRPQRVTQTTQVSGGAQASVGTAPSTEPIALEREVVDQIQARTQFEGSARVLGAHVEMLGSLLDVFA